MALAAMVAWAAVGLGAAPAPAAADGANGLYAPFPGVAKRSRARNFLAKTSVFLSANELEPGKFLTSEGAKGEVGLRPAPAGAPSLRAGVDDPEDPGAGGWVLGGAVVILVLALGAVAPHVADRWSDNPQI